MSLEKLSEDLVIKTVAATIDPYAMLTPAAEAYMRENIRLCAEKNRKLLEPIYEEMGGTPVIIGVRVGYFLPKNMLPETRQVLKEANYKDKDGKLHPDLIRRELPALWHYFG